MGSAWSNASSQRVFSWFDGRAASSHCSRHLIRNVSYIFRWTGKGYVRNQWITVLLIVHCLYRLKIFVWCCYIVHCSWYMEWLRVYLMMLEHLKSLCIVSIVCTYLQSRWLILWLQFLFHKECFHIPIFSLFINFTIKFLPVSTQQSFIYFHWN